MWNPDAQWTTQLAAAPSGLPDDLMSRNTMHNIAENQKRVDYCIDTFHFISNRIKCIESLTGGPYLA